MKQTDECESAKSESNGDASKALQATGVAVRQMPLPDRNAATQLATEARQKLLVLDLDETLVHASETRLQHEAHFSVGPYNIYLRPHLEVFIRDMLACFKVAVWTSSGELYAAQVLERIFPARALEFVWSSQRCTLTRDWTTGSHQSIKNLQKLKSKGYLLDSIIAVDDTPAKYARSYGNLVTVREFVGDPLDGELALLSRYLRQLAKVPNVRTVEKRGWRDRMLGSGDLPGNGVMPASAP
jgi:TFIIF-interacting CTD phosphatase-like protein